MGDKHPSVAEIHNQIGQVYVAVSLNDKALEYHEKALAINLATQGENHEATGNTYKCIANMYERQEQFDNAQKYYSQALSILSTTKGESSFTARWTRHNLNMCRAAVSAERKFRDSVNHEQHDLFKLESSDIDLTGFTCDICKKTPIENLTFHCFKCNFNVCGDCFQER